MRDNYCNNCNRVLANLEDIRKERDALKAEVERLSRELANEKMTGISKEMFEMVCVERDLAEQKLEVWQSRRDELKQKLAQAESETWKGWGIIEEREQLRKQSAQLAAWCERLAESLENMRGWSVSYAMQTYSRVASDEAETAKTILAEYEAWKKGE